MTFEKYLQQCHTKETVKCYCYHVESFLTRYPSAHKIDYDEIVSYIKKLSESISVNTRLAAIKRYYDYLVVIGKRDDHPCRNIRLHQKRNAIQPQDFFTPQELECLINRKNRYSNLEQRNKVVISLIIYQALSPSELCRLNCDNVDLDTGKIFIKGSVKNSARTLDLKSSQITLIQNYLVKHRKQINTNRLSRMLITMRGFEETTDGINSIIEPLKYLYPDRKLNPTTIRQSVIANKLNVQKIPLEEVQIFAGHKWPSTTEQYLSKVNTEQIEKIKLWHPFK